MPDIEVLETEEILEETIVEEIQPEEVEESSTSDSTATALSGFVMAVPAAETESASSITLGVTEWTPIDEVVDYSEEIRDLLEKTKSRRTDVLGHEVRSIVSESEIRAEQVDEEREVHLIGHAAVFNTETVIMGYFREKIAPGAFTKAIKESDVRHLFNHDPNWVLARNKSGTLRLSEDKIGLAFDALLDMEDPQAVSVARKVQRKDVSQSSFAFIIIKETWDFPDADDRKNGKLPLRTIQEVKLFDTSSVTYPAYPTADTTIKSSALDRMFDAMGVDCGNRSELLTRFTGDDGIDDDIAETLRAAGEALEGWVTTCDAEARTCERSAVEETLSVDIEEPAEDEDTAALYRERLIRFRDRTPRIIDPRAL